MVEMKASNAADSLERFASVALIEQGIVDGSDETVAVLLAGLTQTTIFNKRPVLLNRAAHRGGIESVQALGSLPASPLPLYRRRDRKHLHDVERTGQSVGLHSNEQSEHNP